MQNLLELKEKKRKTSNNKGNGDASEAVRTTELFRCLPEEELREREYRLFFSSYQTRP